MTSSRWQHSFRRLIWLARVVGLLKSSRNVVFTGPIQLVQGGTGLGLAITREIIGRMGGSVEFESVEGQGALFWLEIPTVETVAEGNRAPRRAPT
ncbi:hypothetical protein HUS22_09125 [Marinobacter lutaoensis]|jgi:nitrogen-specific signal transduction histidine kinase|nr:hypothetical protein [Marinobacter lutaoensis]